MLTDQDSPPSAVLACVPDAIPVDLQPSWQSNGESVFGAIQEVRELADGYACRLPSDADTLGKLVAFISLDRLCCPFVHWTIDVAPDGGPLWLSMKGGAGVKDVIREILKE